MEQLTWGRHYLVVSATHYRIEYQINPFMDLDQQPQPERVAEQWDDLCRALTEAGARVELLPGRPDTPDMVYAMNLGQVWHRAGRGHVLMSNMRFPQRRAETQTAAAWFADHGYQVHWLGQLQPDGRQLDPDGALTPVFEAGDAFWWRGELLVGWGPRTEQSAIARVGEALGVPTHPVETTYPAMFHLDLSFCPLTSDTAMICPAALDPASAAELLSVIPDPIELSIEQALTFAANAVVVGDVVLGAGLDPKLTDALTGRGLQTRQVDLGQFHLGGGSLRCLTSPLDITLD